MKVGIIGYGSMGKMLVDQFAASGKLKNQFLLVSNRTKEKLKTLPAGANACNNNRELACLADIVFLCVKPGDLKEIIEEISPDLKHELSALEQAGRKNRVVFQHGKKALRSFAVEYPGLAVLHGNKWLIFREKMENQLAMISLGNENESNQFELEWNSEDGFYE